MTSLVKKDNGQLPDTVWQNLQACARYMCYKRIAQGFTISALKLESLMEAEIGRTTKETQPVSFEGGVSY